MKQTSSIAIQSEGVESSPIPGWQTASYHNRKTDIFIRAIIWGIVGSIFGGLYMGFIGMLMPHVPGNWVVIPAAAFAGAVGAAFYGSFQVAIIGTLAGAGSGIAYLAVATAPRFDEMAALSLLTGVVTGFIYGNGHHEVRGALLKALTGLVAGAVAGTLLWLLASAGVMFNAYVTTAVLVPVTGTFYVFGAFRLLGRLECRLSLPLVGSLVAAVLSVVVAGSIWSVHESMQASYSISAATAGHDGLKPILGSILGGVSGGLVAGALYARVGWRWLGGAGL